MKDFMMTPMKTTTAIVFTFLFSTVAAQAIDCVFCGGGEVNSEGSKISKWTRKISRSVKKEPKYCEEAGLPDGLCAQVCNAARAGSNTNFVWAWVRANRFFHDKGLKNQTLFDHWDKLWCNDFNAIQTVIYTFNYMFFRDLISFIKQVEEHQNKDLLAPILNAQDPVTGETARDFLEDVYHDPLTGKLIREHLGKMRKILKANNAKCNIQKCLN